MHPSVGGSAHQQGLLTHPTLPFAYPLRPLDSGVQIHPAFLPHGYPFHASGILAIPPGSALGLGGDKGKSFTIDAILGKRSEGGSCEDNTNNINSINNNTNIKNNGNNGNNNCGNSISSLFRSDVLRMRRQERLEASHPYMSAAVTCPSMAWRMSHTHLPVGKEAGDKKVGGSGGGGSASDWKHGKNKRVRTIFTPEQLERLETEFERQQYMVGTERYYLAASLNLTEAQVKVWFQNRRIKWRKHNLEKQHARLAKLELFNREPGSDSEPETEIGSTGSGHAEDEPGEDFAAQPLADDTSRGSPSFKNEPDEDSRTGNADS